MTGDAGLERELAGLGTRIDMVFPVGARSGGRSLAEAVLADLDDRSRRSEPSRGQRAAAEIGRWKWAVAAAAVIAVVVAVPSSRQAIGRWLGFGSVRIEPVPSRTLPPTAPPTAPHPSASGTAPLPAPAPSAPGTAPDPSASATAPPSIGSPVPYAPLGAALGIGDPMRARRAHAITGLPVPQLDGFAGAEFYAVGPPDPRVQVVVVYPVSAELPEGSVAGIGAVLSTMPGRLVNGVFLKLVGPDSTMEDVVVRLADGRTVGGVWLGGAPHQVGWETTDGGIQVEALRLAGPTLLWEVDGVVFRLEVSVGREAALTLARQVTT